MGIISRHCPLRVKAGFSLLEILVVLALMAILASIVVISVQHQRNGPALRATEKLLAGLVHEARTQAMLHQTRSRVIVAADADRDSSHYLRFAGVIYQSPDNAETWIATDDGMGFPDGVYLWIALSNPMATMKLDFPTGSPVLEGSGSQWYFIEFSATGQTSGRRMVLGVPSRTGSMEPTYALSFDRITSPIGGLMIHQEGTVSYATRLEDWRE